LKESFTTISVGAYLVTYDFSLQGTVTHLSKFGRSLCQNFPTLQAQGHPKWKEVDLSMPKLGPGWVYYAPTTREISSCLAKTAATRPKGPTRPAGKPCSAEAKILGFCN
jgi:uncharacterized protein